MSLEDKEQIQALGFEHNGFYTSDVKEAVIEFRKFLLVEKEQYIETSDSRLSKFDEIFGEFKG